MKYKLVMKLLAGASLTLLIIFVVRVASKSNMNGLRFSSIRTNVVDAHFYLVQQDIINKKNYDPGGVITNLENRHDIHIDSHGCVWDVGAHNGVFSSNSYYLIHSKGWYGRLFEPEAKSFLKLLTLYHHDNINHKVELYNYALGDSSGQVKLRTFPTGTESTTNSLQNGQFDPNHDAMYFIGQVDADIICRTIRETNKCKNVQNILSLDTEGSDQKILLRILRRCNHPFDIIIAEKMNSITG